MTGQGRREFLQQIGFGALLASVLPHSSDVTIVLFSDAGVRGEKVTVPKVVKTDSEWQRQLSPLAFEVARHAGTERSFSGAYWNLHEKGIFRCICCDTALFSSAAKFDSGTGWPSFWQPIAAENVVGPRAQHVDADASEACCRRCDAHLGDIFEDGPKPTGLRYCIDSVSLRFVKAP
ncbi:MAG: methionine-R-sulfoxide reductase [Gemmatimonadetes bacterium]|nr:methionine-R-sulfoxide reductase [Gemmatimonadota bacterium]